MEFDPKDIIGNTYGNLKIDSFIRSERNEKYKHNKYYYDCICKCGNHKEICRTNLITGHTISCGCRKKRIGKENPCWGGHGEISGKFWSHIKKHAENRGLEFSITIEDAWKQFLKQKRNCALTGIPLTMKAIKSNKQERTASLDRINNNDGYVANNIQWLHKDINWMKGKYETDYFIMLCEYVTQHKKGK